MSQGNSLPSLSRIAFFRFKADELIAAVAQAIAVHKDRYPAGNLSPDHEAVSAWAQMSIDVPNGGFTQFFYNRRGDCGVAQLANLLDSLVVPRAGALVRDALVVFHKHQAAFVVENPWDGLFGKIRDFEKLERAFERIVLRANRALETWIRSHIAELAIDETRKPIDPQFTGSVEIMQPNGLVGEYLEVKRGKPNGAYREFFDDGTVRRVVFYKSGKASGDFWPDGQIKRKESKRGNQIIIEWFYPSGQLQKRYVKDKDYNVLEPVRLFHENGQLAEQVTIVKANPLGPWLKYFDDGSPQLQAEFVADRRLVVHNAWNEERIQVVKDGKGMFCDDGCRLDWEYDVFTHSPHRSEKEVQNGIPHGRTTSYFDGVLCSVSNFENGVQEGTTTVYYDNGRIRSVEKYVQGKCVKSKSFPMFDNPVPAVLLRVEANAKLYTAWEHIHVDEYPRALNLDDVRGQLAVPAFLREVHERNLAKSIKSDYEDWNTFSDGIAYFLTVSETGEVTRAVANGSGVYSGGNWGTYPPLLMELRFAPGRIRGRAVECRVLVCVDHCFVEGRTE